jgi:hypothetical protein
MAHVLATFGQFERRLIGQRTKGGARGQACGRCQARASAEGPASGRQAYPPSGPEATRCARSPTASIRTGCRRPEGGKEWYAATVRHVLLRTLLSVSRVRLRLWGVDGPLPRGVGFGSGAVVGGA